MSAKVRFTKADAEARHGRLVIYDEPRGHVFGECEVNGVRCWTFGDYSDRGSLEQTFIQHAAIEVGVCWACSHPEADWPNREACERCWLMFHAHLAILPRDCPPFPGAVVSEPT